MHFVDECVVRVEAGRGGDGCIAFRREKFVPFGGPSGGDGGRGGSVVFVGDEGLGTLLDLKHVRIVKAERGQHGQGKDRYGRGGKDERVRVPLGTEVYDEDTGERLGEITKHESELVVARGGTGGRGNIHFATPVDRAPRHAEPGTLGETRTLRLELKVMADVGLLGFPNVGKSTFIRSVSRARPKVADYPFTTLVPNLGVVKLDDWIGAMPGKTFVVADIPGLVPGASEGAGLGIRFLKHLERTRVLLHLISIDLDESRDPFADYQTIRRELAAFDERLAAQPELVVLNKADLTDVRDIYEDLKQRFSEMGKELFLMSGFTKDGIAPVIRRLGELLAESEESTESEDPDSNES